MHETLPPAPLPDALAVIPEGGRYRPRLVIVESPYAGDVNRNVAYARACLADCLRRGEAPIASHLLYTQPGVLNDDIPGERRLGIDAGLAWADRADAAVFYTDLGWSRGMLDARERHLSVHGIVEERVLGWWHQ